MAAFPDPDELDNAALSGNRVDMFIVVQYMRSLLAAIDRELNHRSSDTTPVDGILMTAPHGSIYKLHINDSGGIDVTIVYDSGFIDPGPP